MPTQTRAQKRTLDSLFGNSKDAPIEIESSSEEEGNPAPIPPKRTTKQVLNENKSPRKRTKRSLESSEDTCSEDECILQKPKKRKHEPVRSPDPPLKRRKPNESEQKDVREGNSSDDNFYTSQKPGRSRRTRKIPVQPVRPPAKLTLSFLKPTTASNKKQRIIPPQIIKSPLRKAVATAPRKSKSSGSVAHLFDSDEEPKNCILEEKISTLEGKNKSLEQELSIAKKQLESTKKQLEEEHISLKQQMKSKDKQHADELKSLKIQLNQKDSVASPQPLPIEQNKQIVDTINMYRRKKEKDSAEIKALKEAKAKLQLEAKEKDSKILALSSAAEACKSGLVVERRYWSMCFIALGQEKTKLKHDLRIMQSKFESTQRDTIRKLRTKESELQEKVKELKAENTERAALKLKTEKLDSTNKKLSDEILRLKRDLQLKLDQIRKQTEELSTTQKAQTESAREVSQLRAELSNARVHGSELQNSQKLQSQITELRDTLQVKDNKLKNYEALMEKELKLRARNNKAFSEWKTANTEKVTGLEGKIELLKKERDLLQRRVKELQQEISKRDDISKELQSTVAKLKSAEDSKRDLVNKLQATNKKWESLSVENRSLSKSKEELQGKLASTEFTKSSLVKQLKEKQNLDTKLKELRESNEKLKSQLKSEVQNLAKKHQQELKTQSDKHSNAMKNQLKLEVQNLAKKHQQELKTQSDNHSKAMSLLESQHADKLREVEEAKKLPKVAALGEVDSKVKKLKAQVESLNSDKDKLERQLLVMEQDLKRAQASPAPKVDRSRTKSSARKPSPKIVGEDSGEALRRAQIKIASLEKELLGYKRHQDNVDHYKRDILSLMQRNIMLEQQVLNLMAQTDVLQERWTRLKVKLEDCGLQYSDELFQELFTLPKRKKVHSPMDWQKTVESVAKKPWTLENYGKVLHHLETMFHYLSMSPRELNELKDEMGVRHPYSIFNQKLNRVRAKLDQFIKRTKKVFGEKDAPRYMIKSPVPVKGQQRRWIVEYTPPRSTQKIVVSDVVLNADDSKTAELLGQTKLLRYLQQPEVMKDHGDKDIALVAAVNLKDTLHEVNQKLFAACKNNPDSAAECRSMIKSLEEATKQGYRTRQHRLLYKRHGEGDCGKDPVPKSSDNKFCIREIVDKETVIGGTNSEQYRKYLVEFEDARSVWIKEDDLLYDDCAYFIKRFENPPAKPEPMNSEFF